MNKELLTLVSLLLLLISSSTEVVAGDQLLKGCQWHKRVTDPESGHDSVACPAGTYIISGGCYYSGPNTQSGKDFNPMHISTDVSIPNLIVGPAANHGFRQWECDLKGENGSQAGEPSRTMTILCCKL
jgi:hypothetical protein